MTLFPPRIEQRFAATLAQLQQRVTRLESRTSGIDSGFPLAVLPAQIDPSYSGSGNPSAYINGSGTLTGPYQYLAAAYTPAASDNVLVMPVPAQQTYIIIGSAALHGWQTPTLNSPYINQTSATKLSYRLSTDGCVEFTGVINSSAGGGVVPVGNLFTISGSAYHPNGLTGFACGTFGATASSNNCYLTVNSSGVVTIAEVPTGATAVIIGGRIPLGVPSA